MILIGLINFAPVTYSDFRTVTVRPEDAG